MCDCERANEKQRSVLIGFPQNAVLHLIGQKFVVINRHEA
jgi:hypothetical protein